MAIDNSQSDTSQFLIRSDVPLQFPQFKNAGTLAYLAHKGRGPRYVLVGGKAWYDPADIRAWLEANKRQGPEREGRQPSAASRQHATAGPRKRGRPTKLEQMKRRSAALVSARR
jgi:hypothetical protein